MGPYFALQVRVDEVASVDGAADGGGGEVQVWVQQLVRRQPLRFLGGGGGGRRRQASLAVGNHGRGVALAANARLYQAAAVV